MKTIDEVKVVDQHQSHQIILEKSNERYLDLFSEIQNVSKCKSVFRK